MLEAPLPKLCSRARTVGKRLVKDLLPQAFVSIDCHLHYSLGVDLPTGLRTERSNAALYSTYMPQNVGQPPLIAGHHQPQLSNPRIAPNIEHSTTHPPPHASTASLGSPTATQLTSPAMPENIAMGAQHTGTSRQEIASVQSTQQPLQHCSPRLPAASEFSFHTTPGFQHHTVQLGKSTLPKRIKMFQG